MFVVNCVKATGHTCVKDVLRGMASTGAWLCFKSIDQLQTPVLSLACRLLETISSALRDGKSSVMIQENDITLAPGCICFSTSCISSTPVHVARNSGIEFRTIDFQAPQVKPIAEALLMREGFTHCWLLANKLTSFYYVSRNILIQDCLMLHDRLPSGLHGIGIATVRQVVSLAGNIMRNLLTMKRRVEVVDTTLQDFDITMVGNICSSLQHDESQMKKGTELDVNEASANGRNTKGDEAAAADSLIEEQALVFALNDLFLPRLSGDDHKLFLTVLSEVFPSVDILGLLEIDWQMQLKLARQKPMLVTSTTQLRPATACLEDKPASSIEEAISVAASKLQLQPSPSFCFIVLQLSQLLNTCNTVGISCYQYEKILYATLFQVVIVGPAGCGKTTSIEVLATATQQIGYGVQQEIINTRAIQSDFLFGYWDAVNRCPWIHKCLI